jgi:hypothetical protein
MLRDLKSGIASARHTARNRLAKYHYLATVKPVTDRALVDSLKSSYGSLPEFIDHLTRRGVPRFFIDVRSKNDFIDLFSQIDPRWSRAVVSDAKQLCDHNFRLLGLDRIDLDLQVSTDGVGKGLPWNIDFTCDYRWDAKSFFREVVIPFGQADIKVPWELSRFQHLPTLGQAFWVSEEERFASEFMAQIDDWIESNPPGFGVNWVNTMEVAIRLMNWIWGYFFFQGSRYLTGDFLRRFLKSVVAHARHIQSNVEIYRKGLTTNHTLAAYTGLLYVGIVFPEFREADVWYRRGSAGVFQCMNEQVYDDGVDFENSTSYHRLALEMFATTQLLLTRNGIGVPPWYTRRLEAMFDYVMHYTRPDGRAPLLGDNDDGRLHILDDYYGWEGNDHRYLLVLGAGLFGRRDFKAMSPHGSNEAAWLLGPHAYRDFLAMPEGNARPTSSSFPSGGKYIMRSESNYMMINADEVGSGGLGNHKHNDIFSFELAIAGRAVITDPGTFVYTVDRYWRDLFRSTLYHNTLRINGAEQIEITGWFDADPSVRVCVDRWSSSDEYDLFEGRHSGYERLSVPATHRRQILFFKPAPLWIVRDVVEGGDGYDVELFFHLAPGARVTRARAPERLRNEVDSGLKQFERSAGVRVGSDVTGDDQGWSCAWDGLSMWLLAMASARVSPAVREGWISRRYGYKEQAPILCYRTRATEILTLIRPDEDDLSS